MNYELLITARARKELEVVPPPDYPRIKAAVLALAETPRPAGCQKLKGREGWRIRIGMYRVLYLIDDSRKTVTVFRIGHRRDIYR